MMEEKNLWSRLKKHKVGVGSFIFLCLLSLIGIYAPLLASSQPFGYYLGWHYLLSSFQNSFLFRILLQTDRSFFQPNDVHLSLFYCV